MDYDKLGFDVGVSEQSYKDTVSRLDKIIQKLEKIQKLEGKSVSGGSNNVSGKVNTSSKAKLTDEERWEKQYTDRIRKEAYYLKKGYKQQKDVISEHTKWVLAEEKKLEKKKFLTEQGYIKPKEPKIPLSEEAKYVNRVAKESQLLNSVKYEELRRNELLNKQRQKEIDQRLKQELGIKQNTKSLTSYITKLTSIVVLARKFAHFMNGAIQESAKYIENLNLFAVAYGKTYEQQLDWALGIAEAYGLANNEVVKFAGTFRELSTSLGLVGDTADLVSRTVTNLGYDLSALFNTTVEQAMEKLQSGVFSGNVRPLRAYGIDISQQQINSLFETNEALRQLGVNAQNLNQSDKVLARLIITLQSGKDSFGTMAREINNLQSQFRIFQGSLSNFKLAIGDLLEKPLSGVMVLLNAVIIAMTNLIRTFAPLQTKDETPKAIINTALGAEQANEELDKLNGKLASFDKFNVLQQGGGEGSNLAVTEALNQLLKEQASLYDQELSSAMEEMKNQAVELAEKIEDVVLIGGILLTVFSISKFIAIKNSMKMIVDGFATLTGSTQKLNAGLSSTNILLVSGIIFAFIEMAKAIKEGDTATAVIAGTIGIVLVGALVALEIAKYNSAKASEVAKIAAEKESLALTKQSYALQQNAYWAKQVGISIGAMVGAYSLADSILNSFDGEARKTASGFMALVGVIMAVTAAIVAMKTAISWGTMLPVLLAGVGTAIAGVKGLLTDVESIAGFANGGYTNANLIMTHENGKREWVGKAAGSSAIVNDTQMSDIMEGAVAKGVFSAMRANSAMGTSMPTNENIIIKIGEEEVFRAVRRTAKRQGVDFQSV